MGKARRKEKDSTGGPPVSGVGYGGVGGFGSNEDGKLGKLYLETALLERHLNETDLKHLVEMPTGLEENEWMASHTIALFEHVNLIYGTISEFCTSTSCPDMNGPCMRTYLWFDEKGKKVKVAAPQYIDYVMTFIQKTINDECVFPTKTTNAFPPSFKPIVKKICRLLFHVIAHIYHCHFKEVVLLSLHAHLNLKGGYGYSPSATATTSMEDNQDPLPAPLIHLVFAHFTLFNETFKLVEDKETEILQDLSLAMRLSRSDVPNDSNKENISVTQPSANSSQGLPDAVTSSSGSGFDSITEGSLIKPTALINSDDSEHL
ncbi:MOB kinase activator-like 2 [Folsomia candida]|uniref:MOB kinase activator-like 2 n=1 Tax=Folsomia candida TaxID=158441 RepID=UPI000B8FB123|nr:MOB kinase activator-like 2 [Folsomia candida]